MQTRYEGQWLIDTLKEPVQPHACAHSLGLWQRVCTVIDVNMLPRQRAMSSTSLLSSKGSSGHMGEFQAGPRHCCTLNEPMATTTACSTHRSLQKCALWKFGSLSAVGWATVPGGAQDQQNRAVVGANCLDAVAFCDPKI